MWSRTPEMAKCIAVCPTCHETRLQTIGDVEPDYRPKHEDFEPLGSQPSPDGTAPMCGVCQTGLKFFYDREGTLSAPTGGNLKLSPREAHQQRLAQGFPSERALRAVPERRPSENSQAGVTTLFSVQKDELIKELRELPGDRWLAITTHRIVVVDLAGVTGGEGVTHDGGA